MSLLRKKPLNIPSEDASLRRCLTAFDLTLLGIGAIIGAGVFVLTGVAAATKAGPAIGISYVFAAIASMFAALAYAELATSIGGCGSAYSYAYAGFGELVAWLIGWDLLFEYSLSVSTVAIGWSGYVNNALVAANIHLPEKFLINPFQGGIVNLPAVLIILILTTLLCIGTKETSRFNTATVFIKILTIAIFIGVAIFNVNLANWHPFMPFGWTGVMQGASIVFFAYIGFDALSTAAEETINPQRNLPIGIIAALVVCTTIYIIVSMLLTGIVPYQQLDVSSPVAYALLHIGHPLAAGMIAAGAIAGLTTVMLVMYYGLTRVFFAISRDGLLPTFFAQVHPRTQTPVKVILLSGIIIATIAGLVPINDAAELVNIGTLAAFALVSGGVMILRWTHPEIPRPFKIPFNPITPLFGVLSCCYLMANLPLITWLRFVLWMAIGIVIYFSYSRRHSCLQSPIKK